MARAKVRLNSAGIAEVLRSPGVAADLMARMQPALTMAQSLAPRVSGHYASRLFLEADETDRAVVRLVNDADYAMSVEAAHGVLARALDAAGGEGGDLSKIKRSYTTKSGKTIMATQAQIDNWTRGSR